MKSNKKWQILTQAKLSKEFTTQDLLHILLENRGLEAKKKQEEFLHPDITKVTPQTVAIEKKQLQKTIKRIRDAIEKREQMIVFGDYDVDGIAGTAILWETLHRMGAIVTPYIPSRMEEGYGLSIKGIENILVQNPDTRLIITVDNGIVANEAVDFANSKGMDVIITDHHVPSSILPKSYAIVHTTQLCGTGVAWMLSKELDAHDNDHLALVALATVADLVPLTNANRIVLTEGLQVLHTTKRPGIVALCQEAGIDQEKIGVYEIGHMIGPRLNAMGRIASAMDSLRLLCTKDRLRAKVLAEKLGITNKERQDLTKSLSEHALRIAQGKQQKFLFVYDKTYEEGVIGLVAGKLVEKYYKPSIVLSLGEKISKASARSIAGFNIIEFIRKGSHLLINAGGHPMAAGFTIATENIALLEEFLLEKSNEDINEEMLDRIIKIDCVLPLQYISQNLYDALQVLQPFGMGNPEPTFSASAKILSIRQVGKDKSHLSLLLGDSDGREKFSAIYFGNGDRFQELKTGDAIEIAYVIDENVWNNKKNLQLKIRDIR